MHNIISKREIGCGERKIAHRHTEMKVQQQPVRYDTSADVWESSPPSDAFSLVSGIWKSFPHLQLDHVAHYILKLPLQGAASTWAHFL